MSIKTVSTTEIIHRSKSDPSSSRGKNTSTKRVHGTTISSYLSLMGQIQSKDSINKPLSEYQPTRTGQGAYWRERCKTCESMNCWHMIQYEDEDEEYQKYLQHAVEESLDTFCDQEMSRQLCQMVISSPQKPSLLGQYELSRSYQLTKDDPTPPVIFNRLKRTVDGKETPQMKKVRVSIS